MIHVNDGILKTTEFCIQIQEHLILSLSDYLKNKVDRFVELIKTLQDSAIQIGEGIEKEYQGNQAIVKRLEEYCELLYQAFLAFDSGEVDRLRPHLEDGKNKLEKILLMEKRMMGIDASGQFRSTVDRPRFADEIGLFSKFSISRKTAIVMQGPVRTEDDFTLETIRLYQKLYPECDIILSTWRGEESRLDEIRKERVDIVLSDLPEHSGIMNCAYQTVSSLAGIKRAIEMGAEKIIKTRTDQRFHLPDLPCYLNDLQEQFPLAIPTKQHARIIAISQTTFDDRLYQICDMFLYGDSEDLLLYFSCPLDQRDKRTLEWIDPIQFSKERGAEIWLTSYYLESLGYELKWTLEDSDHYRNELFIIIDSAMIDLLWPKYDNSECSQRNYLGRGSGEQVSFLDWLHAYHQGERRRRDI
ncbi:MAG: WavE lipopolysaccharide synthesis family protein [Lachnospiraceae bacterium]|nr:WavE lipopolysaccharide synthesis family protein [Lachnospiraceae bacterium]